MLIIMSSGEVHVVELLCKSCEIRVENVTVQINLILFELDELNVILGMDFLTKYHAVLDFSNKKVSLKDLLLSI